MVLIKKANSMNKVRAAAIYLTTKRIKEQWAKEDEKTETAKIAEKLNEEELANTLDRAEEAKLKTTAESSNKKGK